MIEILDVMKSHTARYDIIPRAHIFILIHLMLFFCKLNVFSIVTEY